MRQTTDRQYRLWIAWLNEQINEPSREDYYLMQVSHSIHQLIASQSRNGRAPALEKFKLKFGRDDSQRTPQTAEEATRRSQAAWGAMLDFVRSGKGRIAGEEPKKIRRRIRPSPPTG